MRLREKTFLVSHGGILNSPRIRRRTPDPACALPPDLHPVLRRVYANRGVRDAGRLTLELRALLAPDTLGGLARAAQILADAVQAARRVIVAGDYDADGATGSALMVSALRAMGAENVSYVVPDRFRMGYGLSPALVEVARDAGAELLVTVDSGVASLAGVAAARAAGMQVIVTDHHLPGPQLPNADAIVNPNLPGDGFPSKHLAGVGVAFYLMGALRAELRARGWFGGERGEPNLADWLDLVALGTVADVVQLDYNNRILVAQGLARIRAGRARPGILALLQAAGRDAGEVTAQDLGFVVGPRLNAAGRLEDMRAGIECLLAVDMNMALPLAQRLDALNRERRDVEAQMRDEALAAVNDNDSVGVCLFDPGWHEGVVGLVASRVKERLHRPVIAFAPAHDGEMLKGSARSITGLHVRDALAAVDAGVPGLIERFGGHAMAAGLTLHRDRYAQFAQAFDQVCREWLDPAQLEHLVESDGSLAGPELCLDTAHALERGGPWGQAFPEPMFDGEFDVEDLRPVGERHMRYRLRSGDGVVLAAIHFGGAEHAQRGRLHAAYRLVINRWQGRITPELRLEHVWPA